MKHTLSHLGEFGLIQRFRKLIPKNRRVVIGPGDDCALIKTGPQTLVTTDMLIEGIHFRREWMTPEEIGVKAMRVNISDIAGMGGVPRFAVVAVGLPPLAKVQEVDQFLKGLRKAASESGVEIIGGDTNAAERWIISVTLIGEPLKDRVLRRSGAMVGDSIYVTGTLGGSALGLEALKRKRLRGFEKMIQSHFLPPVRLKIGWAFAKNFSVHSLMDVSDGLMGDLGHILEESQVGAEVDVSQIPTPPHYFSMARKLGSDPLKLLLSGGEDYELLLTAASSAGLPEKIHGIPITKIGRVLPRHEGLRWVDHQKKKKKNLRVARSGFRHF